MIKLKPVVCTRFLSFFYKTVVFFYSMFQFFLYLYDFEHNSVYIGFQVLFGKDGYLYIFTGDDGGDGDDMEISQDLYDISNISINLLIYNIRIIRTSVPSSRSLTEHSIVRSFSCTIDKKQIYKK